MNIYIIFQTTERAGVRDVLDDNKFIVNESITPAEPALDSLL